MNMLAPPELARPDRPTRSNRPVKPNSPNLPVADSSSSAVQDALSDMLSDLLHVLRLSHPQFFRSDLYAPWALRSAGPAELARVLRPGPRRLIQFHIIARGRCWIALPDHHRLQLSSGDIVLLPYSDAHTFGSDDGRDIVSFADVLAKATTHDGIASVVHGGRGELTRIVSGYVRCDAPLLHPLLKTLPRVLHVAAAIEPDRGLLDSTVRHLIAATQGADGGGGGVLGRLVEILFIEVLRRHLCALPVDKIDRFAALRDPTVGRALQLLHEAPARDWSVEALARAVGTSRSLLAERFKAVLGQPPMRYLTCWRLQLAARLLNDGPAGVATIAAKVGYDSEAAFSRAFKRFVGQPPAAWRTKAAAPII